MIVQNTILMNAGMIMQIYEIIIILVYLLRRFIYIKLFIIIGVRMNPTST